MPKNTVHGGASNADTDPVGPVVVETAPETPHEPAGDDAADPGDTGSGEDLDSSQESGEGEGGGETEFAAVPRPAVSASAHTWAVHLAALGGTPDGLTKAEMIAAVDALEPVLPPPAD
jgi:hypothetical protein